MVLHRIERAKGYRCYNKELPDMSTSWREIPVSILALIPVSTINEGNSTISRVCYQILAEISLQMKPLPGVGEAQDSSIGSVLKQMLILGGRQIHVDNLEGSHPVMGHQHCRQNLGNGY
jgi:hypothetical protein